MTSITLEKKSFVKQIEFLKMFGNIVSMEEYIESIKRKSKLKNIAITFDDCTEVTFDTIGSYLINENIPATFFVSTCQIENGPLIWGGYLNALCLENTYNSIYINGLEMILDSIKNKILARKMLGDIARSSGDQHNFCLELSQKYPLPDAILNYYSGFNEKQLNEIGKVAFFEVGSHTETHPFLSDLSYEEQYHELSISKKKLESLTGRNVNYLSYPSGDYNADTISALSALKYSAAFAVNPNSLLIDSNFEYPRLGIYSNSQFKFVVKIIREKLGF